MHIRWIILTITYRVVLLWVIEILITPNSLFDGFQILKCVLFTSNSNSDLSKNPKNLPKMVYITEKIVESSWFLKTYTIEKKEEKRRKEEGKKEKKRRKKREGIFQ